MNSRLVEMMARGRLPFRGGQWIDTYNQITDPDCAGTIIAGINAKNHYYVMEEMKTPQAMTPKRTEYGKRVRKDYEAHKISEQRKNIQQLEPRTDGVTNTLTGVQKDNLIMEPVVLGWTRDEKGNVVDRHPVEVANAVTAAKRDNTQNYVVIPANTADGQIEMELGGVCDLSYPSSKTRRGCVQDGGKVTPALTTHTENCLRRIDTNYRIRKLTPRECFRLMGVSERDIDTLLNAGISNSQLYKLAGNSIVVNCLTAIFRQLFIGNFNKVQQTEIF